MRYFYRGRHRKPTHTSRNSLALATASGIFLTPVLSDVALADPPGGWGPIRQCESGNRNVRNPSSTASGYFQITNGTWRANGGTRFASTAMGASAAEQEVVANRIYERRGSLADWNASRSCWAPKMNGSSSSTRQASARQPSNSNSNSNSNPPSGDRYRVKRGDTLSGVFGSDWRSVYQNNRRVIGPNPNRIFPGQVLRV